MNIKAELKHAKKELRDSFKILKRYGIKDPDSFLGDTCGGSLEGEISYASWQKGKIHVLERMAKELEVAR